MPRLKEETPIVARIRRLEALALELGLMISARQYDGQILIQDRTTGYSLEYRDMDQESEEDGATVDFPTPFETQIILTQAEVERVATNKAEGK